MKKTNYTLKHSLLLLTMLVMSLVSTNSLQAQCALACNNGVQISTAPDANSCAVNVNLDMLLEGHDDFFLFDPVGACKGAFGQIEIKNGLTTVHTSGQLTSESMMTSFTGRNYLGRSLTSKVSLFDASGNLINSCWGAIVVEDKLGPVFNCSVDLEDKAGNVLQSGNVFNITCDVDPELIPAPESDDNCDARPDVYLQNESVNGDVCNTLTITRTYGTTDASGNVGDNCTITINVNQPTVEFPDDITWSCQQYAAYDNVIDPIALHALIIANAAAIDAANLCGIAGNDGDDVGGVAPYGPGAYWLDGEDLDISLDPRYDDNVDNPITDTNGACGNSTSESDTRECDANFSYLAGPPYLTDCDINPGGHVPNLIKVPVYRNAPLLSYPANHEIRGLEDADVLELTGSGQPNVAGTTSCNFAVTHADQYLEACPGLGTNGSVFKILRTWTVLNWCTGGVETDVQIIKVLDKKAPTIVFGDDDDEDGIADETENSERYGNDDGYDDQLEANQYSSGPHPECSSSGLIDVPTFIDDCTGVAEVRVFTPVGEATPVQNGGQVVGYRIPSPFLPMGVHVITFQVTDGCGNSTSVDKRIEVIDGIPPVNICREVTQVALSSESGGITTVGAQVFDEGSYDNCGPVYFLVRKMDRADNCGTLREDNRFRDEVTFCCENIGDTVTVVLRAYDRDPGDSRALNSLAANANDCMVEVLIEDKARPNCYAPKDVWTNCDDVADNADLEDEATLNSLFGEATAYDNCNANVSQISVNVDVDLCGVGTVTRTFRAEDDFGNRSLGTCRQTIMIMQQTEYTIDIPGDFQEECDDASPAKVEYQEIGCDLLAVNTEDTEFPVSSLGECKKIIRKYQIINWCEYDGFAAAVEIPRLDINNDGRPGDGNGGSTTPVNHSATNNWASTGGNLIFTPNPLIAVAGGGFYSYEQHIKIYDNTAPDVSYTGDTQFCGGDRDEDPCTGQVDLAIDASDLCTAVTIEWELTAFNNLFTTADFDGSGAISGRFPLGTHTARFYVSDECGNTSQLDVTFEVIDCKAPTPVCYNGLSIDVMPLSGMVEIWASDYNASSFDYCHPIKFAINRVVDANGDGIVNADDYVTTPPAFDSVQFTCADAGGIVMVQLWVGEVSADDVNNWDYCVSFMEVQDNNGVCNGSRPSGVAGAIKTDAGTPVTNVEIAASGDMTSSFTTTNDGLFEFPTAEGNDITVTPMRNDDAANGVSTFDLIKISRHILNVELLDSPYKMIAADANNSGNISTVDLVAVRKVILRVEDSFPNNTSWRFIDKDQIFTGNPLNSVINEVVSVNDISGVQAANFVAVKVGDVSGDAEAQNINGVDGRTFNGSFYLNAKDVEFEAGETIEVAFTSEELKAVAGYQFTMNFNNNVVELAEVLNAEATAQNFGLTMANEGIITASWNGNATTNEAFTLVFTAKNAGTLSEVLTVSSEYTAAEAYVGGDLKNVVFNFGTTANAEGFALFQNTPNPFNGETTVGFTLPNAATATLTVSDVSGKVLQVVEGNYATGYNVVTLNSASLTTGVLYYQLDTDNFTATKKMIIIE